MDKTSQQMTKKFNPNYQAPIEITEKVCSRINKKFM